MAYKLWISEPGVIKHIRNLGGTAVKVDDCVYEISGISAGKLRHMKNVIVITDPRTQIEYAYLQAVKARYSS